MRAKELNLVCLMTFIVGCAGSPPDFSQRTAAAVDKQYQLAEWLSADETESSVGLINAPVCSSTVGHPQTGWAIDGGGWCVVACPVKSAQGTLNQWVNTDNGLRCFATDVAATQLVKVEFKQQSWQLEQQKLFTGFDRSFVSDTEWTCTEQEYQIDPETRQGFWVDIGVGDTYRFYSDGVLMVARAGAPLKLAGNWRGKQGSGVIANDREVFRFAVNYGGGRFDEFRTATRKQLCRFKDNPGPRA